MYCAITSLVVLMACVALVAATFLMSWANKQGLSSLWIKIVGYGTVGVAVLALVGTLVCVASCHRCDKGFGYHGKDCGKSACGKSSYPQCPAKDGAMDQSSEAPAVSNP